jgi:hypothetical protein
MRVEGSPQGSRQEAVENAADAAGGLLPTAFCLPPVAGVK